MRSEILLLARRFAPECPILCVWPFELKVNKGYRNFYRKKENVMKENNSMGGKFLHGRGQIFKKLLI